jgi:hypothetical protein
MHRSLPANLRAVILAGTLSLLLAACGSSGGSSTESASTAPVAPSASATSALCTDLDAAQSAFDELAGTEVVKEGTNTLKTRFAAFQSAVQALGASARTEFATEVQAMDSAVAGLKTAIDQLTDSPSLADAKAVATALGPVRDSFTALSTAVRSAC